MIDTDTETAELLKSFFSNVVEKYKLTSILNEILF